MKTKHANELHDIPTSKSNTRTGFSLIELVLVIVIVGVVGAIATPRYTSSLMRYRVDRAARQVVADLGFARMDARIGGAPLTVVFSTTTDTYQMVGVTDLNNPGIDYTVDLSRSPYYAQIVQANLGGDNQVIFDGFGAVDSGGTVVIQVGQTQKTVVLDPDSAKATVQ